MPWLSKVIVSVSAVGVAESSKSYSVAVTVTFVASRKAAAGAEPTQAASKLAAMDAAVRGHDPQRTLERGYALVESEGREPVTSAEAARAEKRVRIRFSDDAVRARVEDQPDE